MIACLPQALGSSRERFRSRTTPTLRPFRVVAEGKRGAVAALLHTPSRFTVWNLASLASSFVGVAVLAVGGLVAVALVF
jgi:hypothetical protein